MAVARKVSHQISREAQILVGEPTEHYAGALVRPHGSALHNVTIPAEGIITVGEDGLLLESEGLRPQVHDALVSWGGTKPFVAGSFYFVPWSQLISATAFTRPNVGDAAVALLHSDGDVTYLRVDDEDTAELLADAATDLCTVQPDYFANATLRYEIVEHLQQNPLVESDEICHALADAGWMDLDESHVDAILNDEHLPTYFFAHLWFVDDEVDLEDLEEDSLPDLIIRALFEEPDTAQGLLDRLNSAGWAIESIDDVYDVLYHHDTPVFKRSKAWYFDDEIEGETHD